MRQSEFKKKYNPELGRYVKQHIYTREIHGEGLMDVLKSFGSKLFGKTAKEMTKKQLLLQQRKQQKKLVNSLVTKQVIK